MQKNQIVRGRLTGPKSVELDEAVDIATTDVEVLVRATASIQTPAGETVSEFLRQLPSGKRSREEIDQEIRAERASWGDR